MNIVVGWWVVPLIITIGFLFKLFGGEKRTGNYDFSGIFTLLWIVPILVVWLIYFIIF